MNTPLPVRLIDAHHHFWSDGGADQHAPDYLPADYRKDISPLQSILRATVFAECNTHFDRSLPHDLQPVGETRFIAEIAATYANEPIKFAAATIGYADPLAAETPFERILDVQIAAADGRLSAIRASTAWDEDPSLNYPILRTRAKMLADPRFNRALHLLAERDLAFEAWMYHPQLDELTALAKAVSGCTIVLDHSGTPLSNGRHAGAEAATWKLWTEAMARLSEQPNVQVKIGGLAMPGTTVDAVRRAREIERWTAAPLAETIAPYLEHMISHFGAERCIFESNFPVDRMTCDFDVLVEAYATALASLDAAARDSIFAANAARVYRVALNP
jgi:predicted TIM-barrel fold metal-dependent hydrolase